MATNHPLKLDVHALSRQLRRRDPAQGAQARRRRVGRGHRLVPAADARGDPRLHRRLAAQHRRRRHHRVLGAARSARLDAHRRSLSGARLRHRMAVRPLRSLPRRARRRRRSAWKTELRLSRSLLAHGKRAAADRFLRAAKRHGAPADSRAAQLASLLGEQRDRRPRDPARRGARTTRSGLAALDPPKLPEKVAAPSTSTSSAPFAARAWAHALMAMKKWPENYIEEGGRDLRAARSATSCTRPISTTRPSIA